MVGLFVTFTLRSLPDIEFRRRFRGRPSIARCRLGGSGVRRRARQTATVAGAPAEARGGGTGIAKAPVGLSGRSRRGLLGLGAECEQRRRSDDAVGCQVVSALEGSDRLCGCRAVVAVDRANRVAEASELPL
jgi:hypothetical protein